VLSGADIVYRAKMDPPQGAVRLTSVVGGRNAAYSTAVGKILLSTRLTSVADLEDWFGDFPLERKTATTLTTADALLAELAASRERGYGLDDQENEVGVNCLAIPVHLDGSVAPSGAVSISAVTFRCPLPQLVDAVPEIRAIITSRLGPSALG
jgi:IclR family acetate operon transcriptional repressor